MKINQTPISQMTPTEIRAELEAFEQQTETINPYAMGREQFQAWVDRRSAIREAAANL